MPEIPAGTLTKLRSSPHASNLYLIVQQPQHQVGGAWTGYLWACQINGAPAGTAGDLVAQLTVDNGEAGPVDLLDSMTVLIGTTKGDHDKGIFKVRTDQTVGAATVALDIGSTSEIVDIVEDDDWVVVLDEFRLWTRYPRVTEAAGVLSWYKDYDVAYAGLAADASGRREASLPAVPVMGPHRVHFVDLDGTVDVDFDWSDSYTTYPGAGIAANGWVAEGVRGVTSGNWNTTAEDPAAQTYDGDSADPDNDISGLAGFRVWLELTTDVDDPPARFRRGVRYVFTLRRPGEAVDGIDPPNAEPITDFTVDGLSGTFDEGYWTASITILGSQASEIEIDGGALVILFADDWYGTDHESLGPVSGAENILFIGHIADGTITQDPETGDVSFDAISAAGAAGNREMYPVVVENNDEADEWYECPDLTVDRAAWFYLVWHSTLPMICDWYWEGDANEILAMDFQKGDIYSVIDQFYHDRLLARALCDRYDRFAVEVDLQLEVEGSGTTILTLTTADWIERLQLRDVYELPTAIVELGAVNYTDGLITPYLCKAPGTVNRQIGASYQNMNMAVASQAVLNTLAGRKLAALNSRFPSLIIPFPGNWRWFDVWPQEYIVVSQAFVRHTFSSDKFIVRNPSFDFNHEEGAIFSTVECEMETGGVAAQTVDIPDEVPTRPIPDIPYFPPSPPPTPDAPAPLDLGRRIIATDVGVFCTDNIGADYPIWYAVNNGLSGADQLCVWDIKRDPHHWWTSGGTERTLWCINREGIWYMEDFPYGTWTQEITIAELQGAGMVGANTYYARIARSIEVDDLYAGIYWDKSGGVNSRQYVCVCTGGAVSNNTQLYLTNDGNGWGDVKFAPHSAGYTIYAAANRAPNHGASSEAQLWKSTNRGVAWGSINTLTVANKGTWAQVSIPYVDAANPDLYVLWGRGPGTLGSTEGLWRISVNQGTSFSDITGSFARFSKMGTGGTPDNIWFMAYDTDTLEAQWTNTRGAGYVILPLTAAEYLAIASHVEWSAGQLQTALFGTENTGQLWLWRSGTSAWVERTGNLGIFGVSDVYQIDRDSMGSA